MLSTDISYTSNSYKFNPKCVISNRYGINSFDVKGDVLLTGDNFGNISTWNLDYQSQICNKKLKTGIINVKYINYCILSQSKSELSLLSDDLGSVICNMDSKTCTFAKFALLNNESIIAHPNSELNGDISILSMSNNKLVEINNIKINNDNSLGSLHVLKRVTDFQFIASYEIGSIFIFDVRKLPNPINEPVQIPNTSPIHSVEYYNNILYAGTAEGELYSSYCGNVNKCYVMESLSQPENVGIGNILYFNNHLILACWDGTARVLDSNNFKEHIIFHGHSSTVTDLLIDEKNNVLFTSGVDGKICVWDTSILFN